MITTTQKPQRAKLRTLASSPVFILRLRGVALKFHTNLRGQVYSLVPDDEATTFASEDAATRAWMDLEYRPALGDIKIDRQF